MKYLFEANDSGNLPISYNVFKYIHTDISQLLTRGTVRDSMNSLVHIHYFQRHLPSDICIPRDPLLFILYLENFSGDLDILFTV